MIHFCTFYGYEIPRGIFSCDFSNIFNNIFCSFLFGSIFLEAFPLTKKVILGHWLTHAILHTILAFVPRVAR